MNKLKYLIIFIVFIWLYNFLFSKDNLGTPDNPGDNKLMNKWPFYLFR